MTSLIFEKWIVLLDSSWRRQMSYSCCEQWFSVWYDRWFCSSCHSGVLEAIQHFFPLRTDEKVNYGLVCNHLGSRISSELPGNFDRLTSFYDCFLRPRVPFGLGKVKPQRRVVPAMSAASERFLVDSVRNDKTAPSGTSRVAVDRLTLF